MTRRRELFLEAYFGQALLNPTEAARTAGFRFPRSAGRLLVTRMAEVISQRELALRRARIMEPDEVLEGISSIARDKHHKDRLRAYELMARINGQLSDKLLLTLDRKQLGTDVEAELEQIRALPAGGSQIQSPPAKD